MIESLRNIWKMNDLRNRIFFTLGILAVYRIGAFIPTPGINTEALREIFDRSRGTVLGFLDLFSGGNFGNFTIFALGITPYITASIILQLMTVVWPYLERLSKEGELGRKKITQYTRYLTVVLSVVQSFGIASFLQGMSAEAGTQVVLNPGFGFVFMTMLTQTTGTAFIMWLGERITERGIGNGMSLIIFAGIVSGLPSASHEVFTRLVQQQWSPLFVMGLLSIMVVVVGFIVLVERAQRRIPVQYAKRVVGRRVMGGQSTHLPLKVNVGGVIPVIFASSILTFPQTFGLIFEDSRFFRSLTDALRFGEPLYNLLYVTFIIFFCYFYTSIVFNPTEVADNMRKYGGFIPGIRPGRATAEYIETILTRITFAGAIYLALIAVIPEFMITGFHINHLPWVGSYFEGLPNWLLNGMGVQFYFGGTSLLIVVGVAMDTVQQIEAQLVMRHYDGFLGPRGRRIRGRRV